MNEHCQNAADFIRVLADLAYRLAAKDIVVGALSADWSSFGSWSLQAERGTETARYVEGLRSNDPLRAVGPEVVRVFWDGRDGFLTVEASPTRFCSAPNEWKTEHTEKFRKFGEELIGFVEDYLIKRLGA